MDITEYPGILPTLSSPTPYVSQYAPGQFTGMTNHRSPFAHSDVKIAKEMPTQATKDIYAAENLPKSLNFTNVTQPKLGDIRDKVRRN
jgi:hypothetical protein